MCRWGGTSGLGRPLRPKGSMSSDCSRPLWSRDTGSPTPTPMPAVCWRLGVGALAALQHKLATSVVWGLCTYFCILAVTSFASCSCHGASLTKIPKREEVPIYPGGSRGVQHGEDFSCGSPTPKGRAEELRADWGGGRKIPGDACSPRFRPTCHTRF